MFSKFFETAKDSASKFLSAGKTVLQDVPLFLLFHALVHPDTFDCHKRTKIAVLLSYS